MNHEETQMRAHEQAMEDTAARYFLDELSESERDAFEEHFFDCSVCAGTVRAGAMLADVPKPIPVPLPFPAKRPWSSWLSQAAAAVMAVALGAQYYTGQLPRIVEAHQAIISMAARGPNDNVYQLAEDEELSLSFDVPPDHYQTYQIGVRTAKGKTIDKKKTISAETAKQTQTWLLQELPAGSYELVIEGVRQDGNRTPVAKIGFEVQR
jgi:methionine-rich copper-binding protein CopC